MKPLRRNAAERLAAVHSRWGRHRWILLLAATGCAIATYLCLYQYHVLPFVWDPLFGAQSERVLHFDLLYSACRSIGLPLHDALLGAGAYLVELALAAAVARSRVQANVVVVYAAVTLMLGATAIVLVGVQAIVLGAWCTLCLTSAAISVLVVLLSWPEIEFAGRQLTNWTKMRPARSPKRLSEPR